jgi:hypothetical protein
MYPLRRKRFRRKQFFAAEGAAKVRVRGKNSFDEMFFGEEEHNLPSNLKLKSYALPSFIFILMLCTNILRVLFFFR